MFRSLCLGVARRGIDGTDPRRPTSDDMEPLNPNSPSASDTFGEDDIQRAPMSCRWTNWHLFSCSSYMFWAFHFVVVFVVVNLLEGSTLLQ